MAFIVTRSQSNGFSLMCNQKICRNCLMLLFQCEPKSLRSVFVVSPCWIDSMKMHFTWVLPTQDYQAVIDELASEVVSKKICLELPGLFQDLGTETICIRGGLSQGGDQKLDDHSVRASGLLFEEKNLPEGQPFLFLFFRLENLDNRTL